MKLKTFLVAAVAAAVFASGAQAATITNNETKAQTIKVLSGDREQSFTLNPADMVAIESDLCQEVCILALQNGDEFEFALTDDLVLEDGAVFMNPPQQGAAGEPNQNRQ